MPKLKYLFPESPLTENQEPESPLTVTTNKESATDVYSNDTAMTGKNTSFGTGLTQDKLALGSEIEPSTFENPIAGGFYISGPVYCDTCNSSVEPSSLALPTHLGHNLRDGDAKTFDIDQVHRTGGNYRIEAAYSAEPTNPSGMSDGTTKPLVKGQAGDAEGKSDYSWCPKPIESDDWQKIQADEAMRGNPEYSKLIHGEMGILDDDDRTVAM